MTATDRMLAELMTAGLVLSGLPGPRSATSDPEQDFFPANLLLELTVEYISKEGLQIVTTPSSFPETLFTTCFSLNVPGKRA